MKKTSAFTPPCNRKQTIIEFLKQFACSKRLTLITNVLGLLNWSCFPVFVMTYTYAQFLERKIVAFMYFIIYLIHQFKLLSWILKTRKFDCIDKANLFAKVLHHPPKKIEWKNENKRKKAQISMYIVFSPLFQSNCIKVSSRSNLFEWTQKYVPIMSNIILQRTMSFISRIFVLHRFA